MLCKKCSIASDWKENGKTNIAWHPNMAFILTCFKCGEIESFKLSDKNTHPLNEEEFDESIK